MPEKAAGFETESALFNINLSLLGALSAYTAGILATYYYPVFRSFPNQAVLLLGISLWLLIGYWRRTSELRFLSRGVNLVFWAVLFIGGSARLTVSYFKPSENHIFRVAAYKTGVVRGKVVYPPVNYPRRNEFYLEVESFRNRQESRPAEGLVKIYTAGFWPRVRVGEVLEVSTRLFPLRSSRVPGLFNYRRYLKRKGVWLKGKVSSPDRIRPVATLSSGTWEQKLFSWKQTLSSRIKAESPGSPGNLLRCLFLGERQRLGYKETNAFRRTGLAHLLAISGLHIGILVSALALVFSFLFRLLPARWYQGISCYILPSRLILLLTIIPVFLYAQMVGGRIPTIRALIMLGAYIILVNFERKINLYNLLMLAAFLILLGRPVSLFEVSFQLSFIAVFFIVLSLDSISSRQPYPLKKLSPKNRYLVLFKTYLKVSWAASLATAPVIAYYFKSISPATPLANFLAVPLIYLILPTGFVGLIVSLIFPGAGFGLLRVSSVFAGLLLRLVDWLASRDLSLIHLGKPMLGLILTIYLVWIIWVMRRTRYIRWLLLPVLAGWLIFFLSPSGLKIHLLDLKDKIWVIELPDHKNLVVDGGGSLAQDFYNRRRNPLRSFLAEEGINSLAGVVCIHQGNRHLKGLKETLEKYRVPVPAKPGREIRLTPEFRVLFPEKKGLLKLVYRDFTGIIAADLKKEDQADLVDILQRSGPVNLLAVPFIRQGSALWRFLRKHPPEVTVVRSSLSRKKRAAFQAGGRGEIYSTRKSGTISLLYKGEKTEVKLLPPD
ncbi:MAG: ComEC/Rec2 family competence protein [bacterium]